jgi:23S rRNA A1618 N6-methylase RlmF
MCNPPFYSSIEDVERSAKTKLAGPNAVCPELVAPRGHYLSKLTQGMHWCRSRNDHSRRRRGVCLTNGTREYKDRNQMQVVHIDAREVIICRTSDRLIKGVGSKLSTSEFHFPSDLRILMVIGQVDNYAVTEFVQGQTRRWAVGWSFTSVRLPDVSIQFLFYIWFYLKPSHSSCPSPSLEYLILIQRYNAVFLRIIQCNRWFRRQVYPLELICVQ